ncbi:selenocysteine-specific translation elongation factor [Microbispora hainanensis]|uniref:Selenocysteine-specific translation elongation factor n=1 Tax=Microbispora hainanensis TaxID=568844 RepID=A0A544YPZ3_9ACTN|nr:selenocysteine-specific translation elongation factor [Microbispora hainanensis]TQS18845.1 selenocysteine-specific translation elongation factor [Microbispora hainanensis]
MASGTHVVATAGHVDHGKSTLVRALTGMEPDRLAEERRRGLTIELGYAWTTLPSGDRVAFVDVPGHERFLGTMLAGVGPVPAVMFVVAADEGWMPQSQEHLVALRTLGVRHGLLAVTRADLADPAPALDDARARLVEAGLVEAGLGEVEALAVSGRTGEGLDGLRAALDRLVAALPAPDPQAPVRLWIDRAFSVRGSGTVVTGTLPAGRVETGDELELDGEPVRVRALESLKEHVESVTGVARVALNLRGRIAPQRGHALVTPGAWTATSLADVRVTMAEGARGPLPARLTAHIGSAAVPCEVRPLGGEAEGGAARLRLARPLPLHLGDALLLRDPGRGQGELRVLARATVLDVRPPELRRRGAARERAKALADASADAASLLRTHLLLRDGELLVMGCPPGGRPVAAGWHADPDHWAELSARLPEVVRRYAADHPLEPGMPVEAARHELGLPDRRLVTALVRPPLTVADGRITTAGRVVTGTAGLPAPVAQAVRALLDDLAEAPFQAPDAGRLAALGLGPRELAAAVRAGALLRVAEGVVLAPGADAGAAALLARLPQPFTVSQARSALGTSRRVAVPLLEHLDRKGLTERVDEVHRRCRPTG